MRQAVAAAIVLLSSFASGQTAPSQAASPQSASPQTARQALLEMFFGEKPNHLEKHLPDVTRRSLSKLSSPDAPSVLTEFSMMASQIRSGGAALQTFDTGPTLLTAEDPRGGGPDKIELTVERDDLIGDEDQIELALHMYKNGKEESLPVIPRFTFSMQSDADVWRLNEISVTVRVPLSDPSFLKTIEDQQRSQNEQMTKFALQQVNTAEKAYLAAQGHFACSLAALGPRDGKPNTNAYLWDPQLVSGKKFGYVFVIADCNASHYKVVAEAAVDDSGQRAFCSDESGSVRASADGKASTCLSSGEVVQEAPPERLTGLAVIAPNPAQNAAVASGTKAQNPSPSSRPAVGVVSSQPIPGVVGPAPPPGPGLPQRIRVSQNVMKGLLMRQVEPVYPTMEELDVEGSVVLAVIIGKDGAVQSARVVKSPSPLLIPPALDAVRQWKYKPYLLNGAPIEVDTNATVNFMLPRK